MPLLVAEIMQFIWLSILSAAQLVHFWVPTYGDYWGGRAFVFLELHFNPLQLSLIFAKLKRQHKLSTVHDSEMKIAVLFCAMIKKSFCAKSAPVCSPNFQGYACRM